MLKKTISLLIVICLSMWEGLFFAANAKAFNFSSETIEQSVEACCDTFLVCSFINSQIGKLMQGAAQGKTKKENKKTSNSENDFKTIFTASFGMNLLVRPAKVLQTFQCQISDPLIIKDLIVFYHCFLIVLTLFLLIRSKYCYFLARSDMAPSVNFLLFWRSYALVNSSTDEGFFISVIPLPDKGIQKSS